MTKKNAIEYAEYGETANAHNIKCALGDITFFAGIQMRTFTNYTEKRVFNYNKQSRTGKIALMRQRGIDPTEITFDMVFSPSYDGSDSFRYALDMLAQYAENASKVRLIIANKIVRNTMFVVTAYTLTAKHYSPRDGAIIGGTISVTVTEYANEIKDNLEGVTVYDG